MNVRKSGVAVHGCTPNTWKVEAGGIDFKARLSYTDSPKPAWPTR